MSNIFLFQGTIEPPLRTPGLQGSDDPNSNEEIVDIGNKVLFIIDKLIEGLHLLEAGVVELINYIGEEDRKIIGEFMEKAPVFSKFDFSFIKLKLF